jgi:hypothetical protein
MTSYTTLAFPTQLSLFWDFYGRSSIEVKYVSVAHPRANGQVECTNSLILDGLKKRLYDENSKGRQVDQ